MDPVPGNVPAESDEALLARCQAGDDAAFEAIYRRWQRPILAYIYQIVRNYDQAACIAQDVFLRVFEHRQSFDPQRRFSTWFYTIARNAAIDHLQSRGRRTMRSFTDLDRDEERSWAASIAVGPAEPVDGRLASREANGLLAAALADLPQIHREIIELVVFQECSYEEASEILGGISPGTLRSRMFHALRRLRSALERSGGAEGGLI